MLLSLREKTETKGKDFIEIFDHKIYNRLVCLEKHVRLSSETEWRLEDYEAWLQQEGIPLPQPKTLRSDLKIYANLCDDVSRPPYAKVFRLDPSQSQDAICYFLGQAWLQSPLQPRLSSSIARCFLFALRHKLEVTFNYRELDLSNVTSFNFIKDVRGIPINVIPGTDSAYMAVWFQDGSVRYFNLSRVVDKVAILKRVSPTDYVPYLKNEKKTTLSLVAHHPKAKIVLERISNQFKGLRLFPDKPQIDCFIPEQKHLMIANILESFIRRTSKRKEDMQYLTQHHKIDIDRLLNLDQEACE